MSRRMARYALLIALAMVLSWLEAMVPASAAAPGMKLGLANLAAVFALCRMGVRDAAVISLVRVVLVSITFGNAYSFAYSFAGAALSLAVMALLIRMDSPGRAFYRQERVTAYGRKFRIHKFRTMAVGADRFGSQVTVRGDTRVTRIGVFLRKYRLDELPQLIDVLNGSMSFVGTRPEVPKYVECYTEEMKATLLLPAGITSEASIRYKDEAQLLDGVEDVDSTYVDKVMPGKMKWNLWALERFGLWNEMKILGRTVAAVIWGD